MTMKMMRICSILCLLPMLVASCAPSHKPLSEEDKKIIAVMMVMGAGIGAGAGAAAASSGNEAGFAAAAGLAGAAAGYVAGNLVVEHMNQQEQEIRLSEASKHGDVYVRRMRPNVLRISMERGAEFPPGSAISIKGKGRPIFLPASKVAQHNPWYRRIEIMVTGQPA